MDMVHMNVLIGCDREICSLWDSGTCSSYEIWHNAAK